MLREVVMFLVTIVQQTPTIPEAEALKQWAAQAHSQMTRLNINGFCGGWFSIPLHVIRCGYCETR